MPPRILIAAAHENNAFVEKLSERINLFAKVLPWYGFKYLYYGKSILEAIQSESVKCDYAIFVIDGTDEVKIKGKKMPVARDNVIFEYGIFISKIGPRNCFFLVNEKQKGKNKVRIPTDFAGHIHPTAYFNGEDNDRSLSEFIKLLTKHIETDRRKLCGKNRWQEEHKWPEKINWNTFSKGCRLLWEEIARNNFKPELIICTPDASSVVTGILQQRYYTNKPEVYSLIEEENNESNRKIFENKRSEYHILATKRWLYAIPKYFKTYKNKNILLLVIYTGSGETVRLLKEKLIDKFECNPENIKIATLIKTKSQSTQSIIDFYWIEKLSPNIITPFGHVSRAIREGKKL